MTEQRKIMMKQERRSEKIVRSFSREKPTKISKSHQLKLSNLESGRSAQSLDKEKKALHQARVIK